MHKSSFCCCSSTTRTCEQKAFLIWLTQPHSHTFESWQVTIESCTKMQCAFLRKSGFHSTPMNNWKIEFFPINKIVCQYQRQCAVSLCLGELPFKLHDDAVYVSALRLRRMIKRGKILHVQYAKQHITSFLLLCHCHKVFWRRAAIRHFSNSIFSLFFLCS